MAAQPLDGGLDAAVGGEGGGHCCLGHSNVLPGAQYFLAQIVGDLSRDRDETFIVA